MERPIAPSWEEFDTLVLRLEAAAELHPGLHKLQVFLLAALGYGYILAILAVLALAIGLVLLAGLSSKEGYPATLKLGLPLLALAHIILRSLWVRLPPPEGLALSRQQAGPLFQVVDDLSRALKGPKIDHILLTEDYNASVAQVPRVGLFGWQKTYLTVGLPLLQALPPDQFRAVLAHELGHLPGAHSRINAWIYGVRKTWYQLVETLDRKQHWGSGLFNRFFQWYAPFFGAYSFVLARSQEYEADRCSAALVGPRCAADALISTAANGLWLAESFWPGLYQQADRQAEPPAAYAELRTALRAGHQPEQAARLVLQALVRQTRSEDTHPSLPDRLAALGQEARLPALAGEPSAAEHFLGETLEALTERLDQAWRARAHAAWQERYAYAREARQCLSDLEAKARTEPLTLEEAWQRAYWTEEFQGGEAALPLYQAVLEAAPTYPAALFALGRLYLAQQRAEGMALLEQAMELDAEAILPGCELLRSFLLAQGREREAQAYGQRAAQQAEVLELARAERARLSPRDTYLPHGLSAPDIQYLNEQLAHYPQVAEAHLVRKEVAHSPEKPLYVLGLIVRHPWHRALFKSYDEAYAQQLAQEMEFPGETLVIVLNCNQNKRLRRAMKRVAGARVYRRPAEVSAGR
ncbi:MAG: M48 family metallopeptidase [Chloroflexi bacterium]|nr:M48 family metallopeptidase [Chloroflexota bacterium]